VHLLTPDEPPFVHRQKILVSIPNGGTALLRVRNQRSVANN
jgi:hypothetical protein